jgi:hypothetical protein
VGKTRLIWQAALAIARGVDFLGMPVPKPLRVLMVDLENQTWALRDRLLRMHAGDVPNLYLYSANNIGETIKSTDDGMRKLLEYVGQIEPDLVWIDPWRIFLAGDENSAPDVMRGLGALGKLKEARPSLTIGIVHHVRKDKFEQAPTLRKDARMWTAENVSGHTALPGHVDSILGLDREQDGAGEEMLVFGGVWRNGEPPPCLILEESNESLLFKVCGGDDVAAKLLHPAEQEIWKAAVTFKDTTFGFKDLLTKARTTNRKGVASTLKKMRDQGRVERVTGGTYDKWRIVPTVP